MKRKKVLVCLSGGVDSAVSAALLVKNGYDVTGAYMINYYGKNELGESCFVNEYRDAVKVAARIGVPILKLDFAREYEAAVLKYMYSEYKAGRTPNPDVLCNTYIKFGVWLKKAKSLGFDYLATGHYAGVKQSFDKTKIFTTDLLQAKDKNKDQTYFLHQLNQEQLASVFFPIGDYTKPEVRKLAKQFALPVAEKQESMGICFIGEVPMKQFLQRKIKKNPGNIINIAGKKIGEHEGLSFYTVGQRHLGFKLENMNSSELYYVIGKNIKTNQLVIGTEVDLWKTDVTIGKLTWVNGKNPETEEMYVRFRHRAPLQKCRLQLEKNTATIHLLKPERAPTAGQFAVFYDKKRCLGGGVIL